jgi:hypothetical protein
MIIISCRLESFCTYKYFPLVIDSICPTTTGIKRTNITPFTIGCRARSIEYYLSLEYSMFFNNITLENKFFKSKKLPTGVKYCSLKKMCFEKIYRLETKSGNYPLFYYGFSDKIKG